MAPRSSKATAVMTGTSSERRRGGPGGRLAGLITCSGGLTSAANKGMRGHSTRCPYLVDQTAKFYNYDRISGNFLRNFYDAGVPNERVLPQMPASHGSERSRHNLLGLARE